MTPLEKLIEAGQSYWLDNLSRQMLDSGELERRVREERLCGVTSNPSTFQKSVAGSDAYDGELRELGAQKLSTETLYEELAVSDVRRACDVLRPAWKASEGADGFVSLEVSPHLAHDTAETMAQARRLSAMVDRPNVMIKIPATQAGIPAIEQMLYEGIHINITLLFSVSRYEAVAHAYLRAMERRIAADKTIQGMSSVASFFLSRIDVLADSLLAHRLTSGTVAPNGLRPGELLGKAAVANAKVAYQTYKGIFAGERWERLRAKGARVQRLLWASTSTKNPLYQDVRYVEPLVGRDTVNTMPEKTIEAFADHGVVVADSIESDVDESKRVLEALFSLGLDLERLAWQLENEGIQKFVDPFDETMKTLARERGGLVSELTGNQWIEAGPAEENLRSTFGALAEQQFAARVLDGDPTLWWPRENVFATDRLQFLRERLPEMEAVARDIKDSGYTHAVILARGRNRLCAKACSRALGSAPGWLNLVIPEEDRIVDLRDRLASLDPKRTLFVSLGGEGEAPNTLSAYRLCRDWIGWHLESELVDHFVTIAAASSPEYAIARSDGCRHIFEVSQERSQVDTALSPSSFVPMALLGADLEGMLDRVELTTLLASTRVPPEENPPIALGAFLGAAGKLGRDKVWFLPAEKLDDLSRWAGRLLEERAGLIPILDEPVPSVLADPTQIPSDRVVVRMALAGDRAEKGSRLSAGHDAPERLGFPVARIELSSPLGLVAELRRWELAAMTSASILGVDWAETPTVERTRPLRPAAARY